MAKKERIQASPSQTFGYFAADLEMERISKYNVRYKVKNHSGFGVENLTHIQVSRKDFPKDDDFSMDFINADLQKLGKTGDRDDEKSVAKLIAKQDGFKQLKNLKLMIVGE